MSVVLPLLSAIVSLVFTILVFDQFLVRRKPYQLVWSVGLLWYFLSTGAEFWTGAFGVNTGAYRLWYLCGAIFTAAYLGMGTLYLLLPKKTAHIVMAILGLASLFAIYKAFATPVNLAVLPVNGPLSGEGFPPGWAGPRLITPFFNTFGTLALVGGALYSAWVFWRKRILPHRVVSNVMVAIGALLPVFGGSTARLGNPSYLYLSELLGIIIIFVGFLRSKEVFGVYRVPLVHGFKRVSGS
ncbi:MAG: hypothetical protein HYX87_03755 [Chloroflexi bacterium]|nr:hypothetical protein [Chloroflexota bacterium]